MPSHRSTKAKRASASDPTPLRAGTQVSGPGDSPGNDSPAAPIDRTDEAAGRLEQRKAIEQAMARQNVHLARSPGAIGPIGRTVLLIALFALVGLIAVWVLLAL